MAASVNESLSAGVGLTYNNNSTMLTAGKDFVGETIDLSNYAATVVTLNAKNVKNPVKIVAKSKSVIYGSEKAADIIYGSEANDTLYGNGGNDTLVSGEGSDVLLGGAGNDSLVANGSANSLNAGKGNDTLVASFNDTLEGGAGNDIFIYKKGIGKMTLTDYATGTDTISLPEGVSISASQSNEVKNGKKVTKYLDLVTTSNDTIRIMKGTGKDIIFSNGASTNKMIFGARSNEVVFSITNDDVSSYGGRILRINSDIWPLTSNISVGAVNASKVKKGVFISNYDRAVQSIVSGSGNDTIYLNDAISNNVLLTTHTVSAGNGDDSLNGFNRSSDSISGGEGADTLYSGASNSNYVTYDTLTGGKGKDVFMFNNASGAKSINVVTDMEFGKKTTKGITAGNDTLFISRGNHYNYTVDGANKDIIFTNVDYYGSAESRVIVKNGLNKFITVKDRFGVSTIKYTDPRRLYIGDDMDQTIDASEGYIKNSTGNVVISSDQYTIYDAASTESPRTQKTVHILGNSRDETMIGSSLASGDYLDGAGGNDSIIGGKGKDTLIGGSGANTLTGGSDSDVFVISNTNTTTKAYDLITDYTAGEDKLVFTTAHGITGSTIKGKDVILSVGANSASYYQSSYVTLKGAKGKEITIVDSTGYETKQKFGNGTSTLRLTNADSDTWAIPSSVIGKNLSLVQFVNAGERGLVSRGKLSNIYDEKYPVNISGSNSDMTLTGGHGNDTLRIDSYSKSKLLGGEGNDNITGGYSDDILQGGAGADTINARGGNDTIDAGAGKDIVYAGVGNDSIDGGAGDDTLYGEYGSNTIIGGDGNDIFVYSASGEIDLIKDYKPGQDTILFANTRWEVVDATSKGKDITLLIGTSTRDTVGSITLKNGRDKEITMLYTDGYVTRQKFGAGSSTLTVNNEDCDTLVVPSMRNTNLVRAIDESKDEYAVNLQINKNFENKLYSNLLKGGSGNDTLTGDIGNDQLIAGAGDDSLNGGRGNNLLTGGAGKDVFICVNGNDTITDFKYGEDLIGLESGEILSATAKSSNIILKTTSGTLTVKNGKGKKLSIEAGGETTTQIFASGMSTLLVEETSSATIDLSEIANTKVVKTIDASARTTSVNLVGGSDKGYVLKGGEGADTLEGGAGNDTLTGADGADVFVYSGGNDLITDYKEGDTIQLKAGSGDYTISKNNVVFSGSNGTLTVKNGKGKKLHVVNANGADILDGETVINANVSKKEVPSQNVVEDVWFTEGDDNYKPAELEAIQKTSQTDYSVGKIDTPDLLNKVLEKISYSAEKKEQ